MDATTSTGTPRVWVGCLGCYNAGRLVGDWFDATEAPEDEREWLLDLLAAGAQAPPVVHYAEGHEELWVFDHENFYGALSGECSPSEAKRIAEAMTEAAEVSGADLRAVAAYIANDRSTLDTANFADGFEESYQGEYGSGADYAQELAEDSGLFACHRLLLPHRVGGGYGYQPTDLSDKWPFACIDWEHAWRELSLDGYWTAPADPDLPNVGAVYVFRSV